MSFNTRQTEAIQHGDGPCLVIAGPGSGKTTVIVQRIENLIKILRVPPENILVVTFTRNAAAEMKNRAQKRVLEAEKVVFGTFHSIFYSMLKKTDMYRNYCILDDFAATDIVRKIARSYEGFMEGTPGIYYAIFREIAYKKTGNEERGKVVEEEAFRYICAKYEEYLSEHKLMDFEDILILTKELLRDEAVLKIWQDKFKYILVDEFQDINPIQYEIIKNLAGDKANLFAVGDDDQSIYRFRGAEPSIMQGFPKDFPKAKMVILNENYRCGEAILKAACKLISKNTVRYEKDLKASSNRLGDVYKNMFLDSKEASGYICDRVKEYHERAGIPYGEMAVLYRTNSGALTTAGVLAERGIPFSISGDLKDSALFLNAVYKDLKAILRVATGSTDRADYIRTLNISGNFVPRSALNDVQVEAKHLFKYYKNNSSVSYKLRRMKENLEALSLLMPCEAINFIRKNMGYNSYIRDYCRRRGLEPEISLAICGRIELMAKKFDSISSFLSYCGSEEKKYLERINSTEGDRVHLMTMHKAKGLEYRVVFIENVNEGIVPYSRANSLMEIEEERRMLYVAMTRAKDHLHVMCVKERFGKELKISPFLKEF